MIQRKGLADLFAAMKRLDRSDIDLIVLGTPLLTLTFYRQEYPDFRYEPTRPTKQVRELMLSYDVLVLPSIVVARASSHRSLVPFDRLSIHFQLGVVSLAKQCGNSGVTISRPTLSKETLFLYRSKRHR
jgi:hypothetical protein